MISIQASATAIFQTSAGDFEPNSSTRLPDGKLHAQSRVGAVQFWISNSEFLPGRVTILLGIDHQRPFACITDAVATSFDRSKPL
jgi:hypothetical protein